MCDSLGLIHCVAPFVRLPVTKEVHYFRLHGIGGYRYRFTDDDLKRVRNLCGKAQMDYVLFNNLLMFDDAVRFMRPS